MQVGTDANANLLRDFLHSSGVKLDYLREIEGPTGSAIILLQPSGSIANRLLTQHCCQPSDAAIAQTQHAENTALITLPGRMLP